MNLSAHFSLAELTQSDYAIRHGLDNSPNEADILDNLHTLAAGLERVRVLLGNNMIYINSGYRAPKVNAGVGGSKTSAHMFGLAADFTCPTFGTPREICVHLRDNKEHIGFDQLIHEGAWVHIAFPPADQIPKMRVMTAIFKKGGGVSYVEGVA
jgi:zinc D-Ala-D-Ala carboxypeptidase